MSNTEKDFSEEWYVQKYPDVARAIKDGTFRSGYDHFVSYGQKEGRLPKPEAGQRAIPELVSESQHAITLELSERVLHALKISKVFVGKESKTISISKQAKLEQYVYWDKPSGLHSMGAFSYSMSSEWDISVGRFCSIAPRVATLGERHPMENVTSSSLTYDFNKPHFRCMMSELLNGYDWQDTDFSVPLHSPPPVIGHDVWIGQDVLLARGIKIHTGCVVAAGSVVTKDVEPYTIVGGVPAKPIRRRFNEEIAERLLSSSWWEFHPKVLFDFKQDRPEEFLEEFERQKAAGNLRQMKHSSIRWEDLIVTLSCD